MLKTTSDQSTFRSVPTLLGTAVFSTSLSQSSYKSSPKNVGRQQSGGELVGRLRNWDIVLGLCPK